MSRSGKPRISKPAGRVSKGGRPLSSGDRYPSGKLKPKKVSPNPVVLERRRAVCDDPTKASTPLDAAYANGWLSEADYSTGQTYAALRARAGFGRRGGAAGSRLEVDAAIETSLAVGTESLSYFSSLPNAEVAALWDAVFNDHAQDRVSAQERAAKAMRMWKAANAAMTAEQRQEVEAVCVLESWPQWILQRRAGRMDTSWERKRDLLIAGLGAVRSAISPRTAAAEKDDPTPKTPVGGPARVERLIYVDEDGQQVLEVERVRRRTA